VQRDDELRLAGRQHMLAFEQWLRAIAQPNPFDGSVERRRGTISDLHAPSFADEWETRCSLYAAQEPHEKPGL
jgi:hypothetical protein